MGELTKPQRVSLQESLDLIEEIKYQARREILKLSGILLENGDHWTAVQLMEHFGFPVHDRVAFALVIRFGFPIHNEGGVEW